MIKQFTNSFFRSNTFLYVDDTSSQCVLIDCGDTEDIINYINTNKLEVTGILITHSHYDHIYGINNFHNVYPNLPIYTSEHGKKGLLSEKLNLSKYHDYKFVINNPQNICIIENVDSLIIGNILINILETPGHDQSCISYMIENYIFTGDSYLPSYKLISIFPKSNKKLAIESELKIKSILKSEHIICPGHGNIICFNDL